jgi:tetratricopeptide (TPR) repeat protein
MGMDDPRQEAAGLFRDEEDRLDTPDGPASRDETRMREAYLIGLERTREGEWDEALLYLEQVVTGEPETERGRQCRMALAYVYAMTGRFRLAEYEVRKLMEAGVESVQLYAFQGYAAWAQGRPDEAIRLYEKALELDPDNANALNGLGYVLACEGRDSARALTCCRKAVDKKPENPAYLDSLGWAYYRLGFIEEARTYLGRALARAPDESEILAHVRALENGD